MTWAVHNLHTPPVEVIEQGAAKPKELLDAVGELALAIKPRHMDVSQRRGIAAALHVLVDHIIAYRETPHAQ